MYIPYNIHEQETSVCNVYVLHSDKKKQRTQVLFDKLSYSFNNHSCL